MPEEYDDGDVDKPSTITTVVVSIPNDDGTATTTTKTNDTRRYMPKHEIYDGDRMIEAIVILLLF